MLETRAGLFSTFSTAELEQEKIPPKEVRKKLKKQWKKLGLKSMVEDVKSVFWPFWPQAEISKPRFGQLTQSRGNPEFYLFKTIYSPSPRDPKQRQDCFFIVLGKSQLIVGLPYLHPPGKDSLKNFQVFPLDEIESKKQVREIVGDFLAERMTMINPPK